MAVQFFFEDRYKDSVSGGLQPPDFCKPFLWPGADILYTSGKFANFLSQEIKGSDYTICEYRFYVGEKGLLYPFTEKPLLTLVYIMKGTVTCLLQGLGEVELTEGNYYFFYVPAQVRHEAYFEPGDYVFFHINLDPNYLFQFTTRQPSMKELIRRQKDNVPAGLRESTGVITLKERIIVEQITQSTEENDERDMFIRGRIYDLLLLYSKDLQRKTEIDAAREANRNTDRYVLKLMEAKNLLDFHKGNPMQIEQLSRKLGVNSQVLKREFKAAFGTTIYAYQMQIRMDRACQLLLRHSVSIDEIADEVGYKNSSSFIEKFKELFGITPYRYHKKYNK